MDTLRTGKSLAVSLRKMGRLDEAYVLTKEHRRAYERSYGEAHPDSLACRLNLACDLSAREDKVGAFEVASQVLQAYQATIGGAHPFTLVAQNNISTYLRGVGTVREALGLVERTLNVMRESLGDDHPFTLSCESTRRTACTTCAAHRSGKPAAGDGRAAQEDARRQPSRHQRLRGEPRRSCCARRADDEAEALQLR